MFNTRVRLLSGVLGHVVPPTPSKTPDRIVHSRLRHRKQTPRRGG
jgi:hypothetical protein